MIVGIIIKRINRFFYVANNKPLFPPLPLSFIYFLSILYFNLLYFVVFLRRKILFSVVFSIFLHGKCGLVYYPFRKFLYAVFSVSEIISIFCLFLLYFLSFFGSKIPYLYFPARKLSFSVRKFRCRPFSVSEIVHRFFSPKSSASSFLASSNSL